MSREQVEYPSAMQMAFVRAAGATPPSRTLARVTRVAERVKLHREPAVNTKLSFRTAKKLIAEGVIE